MSRLGQYQSFVVFAIVLVLFQSVESQKNSIDTNADVLRFSWKLSKGFIYVEEGSQLLHMKQNFPENFNFPSVANAKGVWIVLPDVAPSGKSQSNTAAFSFSSAAQLLESIGVRYKLGGNATLNILTPTKNITIPAEFQRDGWSKFVAPFEGSRFSVEATVLEEPDFVLIDRIDAPFMRTTTSTRHPKTTSTTPKPANGAHEGFRTYPTLMILIFVFCCVFAWN